MRYSHPRSCVLRRSGMRNSSYAKLPLRTFIALSIRRFVGYDAGAFERLKPRHQGQRAVMYPKVAVDVRRCEACAVANRLVCGANEGLMADRALPSHHTSEEEVTNHEAATVNPELHGIQH